MSVVVDVVYVEGKGEYIQCVVTKRADSGGHQGYSEIFQFFSFQDMVGLYLIGPLEIRHGFGHCYGSKS